MTSKGHEPAFPGTVQNSAQSRALGAPAFTQYSGMTMRDYLAAKAMQGLCANAEYNKHSPSVLANEAYVMADEMLAAREQS